MDVVPFVRMGILMIRPGALVMTAPLFGGQTVPMQVRIGLTLLLALVLAPVVQLPETAPSLTVLVARELVIGLSIALAIRIVVSAAELAGYLAGFQAGFSIAAIIDPQRGVRNNMIASLYGTLAVFTFFMIDGHHSVLRALADSYTVLPIGVGAIDQGLVAAVMGALGLIFRVGLQLAVPVVVALLVVELALGLIARTAPAMNLMVIGFPIRALAGLVALAVAVTVIPSLVRSALLPALEIATQTALAFR